MRRGRRLLLRRGAPPLPAAAFAAMATSGVACSVATQVTLGLTHRGAVAVAAGLVIAAAFGLIGMLLARRLSTALTTLRGRIAARLAHQATPGDAELDLPDWVAELGDLVGAIDAVCTRAQVADRLATERQQAAETAAAGMFELLTNLVEAEEGARGQLSAELHDTVAQSLMLARNVLGDALATEAAVDPERIEYASELVSEAEDQVRAVMARTRPPALRDGDLARAFSTLLADLNNRYGLEVDVEWTSEPFPLPIVSAVTVYRFFQEALLNVVKHADDTRARACLSRTADTLVASVADSGPGFEPGAVKGERGRHVGLGLLRERARLAGGRVDVTSALGVGTTLTLTLPLGAPTRRLLNTPPIAAPRSPATIEPRRTEAAAVTA